MDTDKLKRYANIGFEDFRAMALDPSLNAYEKIGAYEPFRRGCEEAIFRDIRAKLPQLETTGKKVVDIGPGCTDLPRMLVQLCSERSHELVLVDSAEMLALLPDTPGTVKLAARFPDCAQFIEAAAGSFDVVLVYSVLHYVFREADVWEFLDRALTLLAPGGAMLVGDIPNDSKRSRFFASEAGVRHHKAFTGSDVPPPPELTQPRPGGIDDDAILAMAARARAKGFDAYIVPQAPDLPMANRREDLLIVRP